MSPTYTDIYLCRSHKNFLDHTKRNLASYRLASSPSVNFPAFCHFKIYPIMELFCPTKHTYTILRYDYCDLSSYNTMNFIPNNIIMWILYPEWYAGTNKWMYYTLHEYPISVVLGLCIAVAPDPARVYNLQDWNSSNQTWVQECLQCRHCNNKGSLYQQLTRSE